MKKLMTTLMIGFGTILFAQNTYNEAMESALQQWENVKSQEEITHVVHQFERIAAKNSTQWEPAYYAILVKTLQGFAMPKKQALSAMDEVAVAYENLLKLEDNSEIRVLKGLYLTVKIAKDPMKYGPTLSQLIKKSYQESLALDSSNPRALLNLAQYEMGAAQFFGEDKKDYCPQIQQSITWFEQEEKEEQKGFEPRWGMQQAQEVWTKVCQ